MKESERILNKEIDERLKKLEPKREETVKRIEDIKLQEDEVITRIKKVDGILVEITKKSEVS